MSTGESTPILIRGTLTRRELPKRDKTELRAAVQESVHQFTTMRRARLLPVIRSEFPGETEDQIMERLNLAQPEYQEFDPVVALSVMSADYSNGPELRMKALSEVAQYLRPKLKSIEMTIDPDSDEVQKERHELAARLVGLLDAASTAKRATVIDGTSSPVQDQEG